MAFPKFQKFSQKEMTRKEFMGYLALGVGTVFGITGILKELASHATTPTAATEAEDGTVSSKASIISDSSASGGGAVEFGSGTTSPPPTGTIYGVNSALAAWSGSVNLAYTTRGAWFGRVPCGRGYPTPLPSAGNFTSGGNEWGWAGGTFNEKRVNICFKFNDTKMAAAVANGSHDATIISYINSVPADWTVYLTFYHEYNLHYDSNNPQADFISAFVKLGQLCAANAPEGNVIPTICASSFGFTTADAPLASRMPANTLFLMDSYGNPNGIPSGYKNYGTAYPTPQSTLDAWYGDVINTLGYHNWGLGEFGTPQRVAPALSTLNSSLGWGPQSPYDISGALRAQWITDFCNYAQGKQYKPKVVLLWEGGNGGWNQYFTSAGSAQYDDGTASSPGAHYQGWPINVNKTPMVSAYKAFVDISA